MKGTYINCAFLAAIAVVLSACHKKQDPVSELEKAAAAMAAPETAPAAPAAPDAGPRPAPASLPPAKQVQQALVDFKAGNMEDAVVRLQLLRATSVLSPQQRMALQDSVAAVMTEIYTLAEKGDPRAKAAVARYQQMQTTR
jgi:hypothetical protein